MDTSCTKHPHESAASLCRRCGHSWCGTCLVYAFGPKKPPYCLSCAMVAGGVKSAGSLPPMPRKQLKAQMRALKASQKAEQKAAKGATEAPEPVAEDAAACAGTDWASPWWEDAQSPALAD